MSDIRTATKYKNLKGYLNDVKCNIITNLEEFLQGEDICFSCDIEHKNRLVYTSCMNKIRAHKKGLDTICIDCKNQGKEEEEYNTRYGQLKKICIDKGFELLEYDRKNRTIKYKCSCGKESKTSDTNIKRTENCKHCSNNKNYDSKKQDLIDFCKKFNAKVLNIEDYKNQESVLKFECNCGKRQHTSTYGNFRNARNRNHPFCHTCVGKKFPTLQDFIEYVKDHDLKKYEEKYETITVEEGNEDEEDKSEDIISENGEEYFLQNYYKNNTMKITDSDTSMNESEEENLQISDDVAEMEEDKEFWNESEEENLQISDDVAEMKEDKEFWIEIETGYLSSYGRYFNLYGREMTLNPSKLRYNIGYKKEYVWRLMAKSFKIPDYEKLDNPNEYIVTHKDKNIMNNHLSNIIVMSRSNLTKTYENKPHSNTKKTKEEDRAKLRDLFAHKKYVVVPELPNHFIFETGDIANNKKGLLKFSKHKNTNSNVYYNFRSNGKTWKVHKLVCYAFKPLPDRKLLSDYKDITVNHGKGGTLDNSVDNLEWNTLSENIQHAYDTGLNTNVKPVVQLNKDTLEYINKFISKAEAKRHTGDAEYDITTCIEKGKSTKKSKFYWAKLEGDIYIIKKGNGIIKRNLPIEL
jgi:hypothetical protein